MPFSCTVKNPQNELPKLFLAGHLSLRDRPFPRHFVWEPLWHLKRNRFRLESDVCVTRWFCPTNFQVCHTSRTASISKGAFEAVRFGPAVRSRLSCPQSTRRWVPAVSHFQQRHTHVCEPFSSLRCALLRGICFRRTSSRGSSKGDSRIQEEIPRVEKNMDLCPVRTQMDSIQPRIFSANRSIILPFQNLLLVCHF